MSIGPINTSQIEAMVAQLRAAGGQAARPAANAAIPDKAAPKVDFTSVLKSSLDQVNGMQNQANALGQRFVTGDDKVSLSDVMVSMQKANISFQQTVQVRNKLVSAYHEIMNMPV